MVATVFDLQVANYGVNRGLRGEPWMAATTQMRLTPCLAGKNHRRAARPGHHHRAPVRRQRRQDPRQEHGHHRCGMNHWYHCDMNYRGIINMLMMCGCIGQSGGGWAHYVGQEKLRPQTGWTALAFALDWIRPAPDEQHQLLLCAHGPVALRKAGHGRGSFAPGGQDCLQRVHDRLQRARRAHGMAAIGTGAANQFIAGLQGCAGARHGRQGLRVQVPPGRYAQDELRDPDNPANWPRNMFVWRSNILGSSGKGHEYFLKHLLGTTNGVQGKDLGSADAKPGKCAGMRRRRKASWICW